MMMKLVTSLSLIFVFVQSVAGCDFCVDSDDATLGAIPVTQEIIDESDGFLTDGTTCADFKNLLATGVAFGQVSTEECIAAQLAEGYCCPACNFCGGTNKMTKPGNVIPSGNDDDGDHGDMNGDMRRLRKLLSSSLKHKRRQLNETDGGDEDEDESLSCSDLALLAGLVGSSSVPDPFAGDGTGTMESYTCESFDATVALALPDFDMKAFCGCEGHDDSANEGCYFCGDDEPIDNPETVEIEEGMPCQMAFDFADSVKATDADLCLSILQESPEMCCKTPDDAGNVASVMVAGFLAAMVTLIGGLFL